jgi:hypothetical protein
MTPVAAVAAPAPASTDVAASSVAGETDSPAANRARSASMSLALPYLCSGSFAIARSTIASSSCGTSGRFTEGASGTAERCCIATSSGVSPANGTLPVNIS